LILSLPLWFNLTMDQSVCCYVAWVWKRYHLPPYVGVWDHSFPGIFILHRIALEMFGTSTLGFRFLDFLLQLGGLVAIFQLARQLAGYSSAGFFASLFYGIYYFSLGPMQTGQREGFIFLITLLAVIIGFALQNRIWLRAVLIGLLSGFAFQLKPHYGLLWPVFGAWFLAEGIKKRAWMVWLELCVFGLFCLAPTLAIVLWYWKDGNLQNLFQNTLWFNFVLYSVWPAGKPVLVKVILREIFSRMVFIFVAGAAGIYLTGASRDPGLKKLRRLLVILCLTSLSAYLLQSKFIKYQLIPFWGIMIIFAGAACANICARLRGLAPGLAGRMSKAVFALCLVIMAIATILHRSDMEFIFQNCFRSFDLAYVRVRGTPYDGQASSDFYLAAKYLARYITPDDQIEFFLPYPLIPYLLQKKLPSRFCCVQHLLYLPRDGKRRALQESWIQEYQADVIKSSPRYFVITDPYPYNEFFNLPTRSLKYALKQYFPELNDFFIKNYRPLAEIGWVEIYERPAPE